MTQMDDRRGPFRRLVFYVPGFDPFPPRRYRELYRSEGAAQAAISGYALQVRGLQGGAGYGWTVDSMIDGACAQSHIEVLAWQDLVRASMRTGIWATYRQLFHTAWVYLGSGALFRLMRLRKGPIIAALYPFAVLLAQAVAALLLALGAAWLVALGGAGLVAPQAGLVVAGMLGAICLWAALALCRRLDRWIYAWYLMHDYAFTAGAGGAYPAVLDQAIAGFAARVDVALRQDVDEVLVVGHSSGAHIAVSVMARVLRDSGARQGPALALLTLGQVVPMVSFLPRAARLRGDLAKVARDGGISWVDVTAPGDGCSFALCDPVAVTGLGGPDQRGPLVLSAAFSQTLSPDRWVALRRRYFRLHFQYLCAFDRPGDYDYFRITAGALPLSRRFAGRHPSKSRITTAVSRYRDTGVDTGVDAGLNSGAAGGIVAGAGPAG